MNKCLFNTYLIFFCLVTLANGALVLSIPCKSLTTGLIFEACHFACLLRSLASRFASDQVETTQYPVQQL